VTIDLAFERNWDKKIGKTTQGSLDFNIKEVVSMVVLSLCWPMVFKFLRGSQSFREITKHRDQ